MLSHAPRDARIADVDLKRVTGCLLSAAENVLAIQTSLREDDFHKIEIRQLPAEPGTRREQGPLRNGEVNLARSQPPFLTEMVLSVYHRTGDRQLALRPL